jgi:phosphoenolpyruvate carboxykinase (ATP)
MTESNRDMKNNLVDNLLETAPRVFSDLSQQDLIHQVVLRKEGQVTRSGAVVVKTGENTGRSPLDKYIVQTRGEEDGFWWNKTNQPLSEEKFDTVLQNQLDYLVKRDIFVQHLGVGNPGSDYLPIRVITETAWHSLFSINLFKAHSSSFLHDPGEYYTILHSPFLEIDPLIAGTRSKVFIILNFRAHLILIGGTGYAGEIKKSVFTVMNYVFPTRGILTMHCAANVGKMQDVALFFGLSGTGKTTLSSSPDRKLIGDDEHGWSHNGIFNLEGGCYAKTIHLDKKKEPIIWKSAQRFGSVLENIPYNSKSGIADFKSDLLTENTRAAYPISYVSAIDQTKIYSHPKMIFFLTADAFGILPPLSLLTPEQAIYHFLSGYTSKIAGTETGIGQGPCATFSACYGEPFLPLPPALYTEMLRKKLIRYKSRVWLVNTGWITGPFGKGYRIPLEFTRAIIDAALNSNYSNNDFIIEPFFGLRIPRRVPGVPERILNPRESWENPVDYEQAAEGLVQEFKRNHTRFE